MPCPITFLTCLQCLLVIYAAVGGDALQLGPVKRPSLSLDPPIFSSRTFRDTFRSRYGALMLLRGVHRQSRDAWFVSCLDRIRLGQVLDSDVSELNATSDGVAEEQ